MLKDHDIDDLAIGRRRMRPPPRLDDVVQNLLSAELAPHQREKKRGLRFGQRQALCCRQQRPFIDRRSGKGWMRARDRQNSDESMTRNFLF